MSMQLLAMLQNFIHEHKKQKLWAICFLATSVLLSLSVHYMLMRPVITMTPEPTCGMTEHIHTEACYGLLLDCGEEHEHNDDCNSEQLICQAPEHEHTDDCYPDSLIESAETEAQPTEGSTEQADSEERQETVECIELILRCEYDESFTVEKNDNGAVELYKYIPEGESEYRYTEIQVAEAEAAELIDIKGGEQVYLELLGGGYSIIAQDACRVCIETCTDEGGTALIELLSVENPEDGESIQAELQDGNRLVIEKPSRLVPLTLELSTLGEFNEAIQVQLYCNDASLGEDYCVWLDGVTEQIPWSHCFEQGLPLYAKAETAKYTLRAEAIGEELYSEDYCDRGGYEKYLIDCSELSYEYAADEDSGDIKNATAMRLAATVHAVSGEVFLHLKDEEERPIAGACFLLYEGIDENDSVEMLDSALCVNSAPAKELSSASSLTNGALYFDSLNAGCYYIMQSEAPAGYRISEDIYRIYIDGEGQMELSVLNMHSSSFSVLDSSSILIPRICANLTVMLKSEDSKPVGGAVFSLLKENNDGQYEPSPNGDSITVSESGTALEGLVSGNYRIEEKLRPEGYYPVKPVMFSVDEGGAVNLADKNEGKATHEADILTIYNHTGSLMPNTGSVGTAGFGVLGCMLMLAAALGILILRAKHKGAKD